MSSNEVPRGSLDYAATNLLPSYKQNTYQNYNPAVTAVTTSNNYVTTDVNHPAPVTKVTFGNKQFTETYATRPIETSAYTNSYRPPQPVYQQPIR